MGLFNKARRGLKKVSKRMPLSKSRGLGIGRLLPMPVSGRQGRMDRLFGGRPFKPSSDRFRTRARGFFGDMIARDLAKAKQRGGFAGAIPMPVSGRMNRINRLIGDMQFRDPILAAEQEKADRGIIGRDFADFSIRSGGGGFKIGGDGELMPLPKQSMPSIPQMPTRESIQEYVRENVDLSNLPQRMPNIQMFQQGGEAMPYVSGATRIEAGLDPLSRQLLFGLDGKGGFIPGAFRAAERTFFTPEGEARVVPEEVAGLTPDQLRAMELARQVGLQDPFIQQARGAYTGGLGSLQRQLGQAEQIARGATGIFGAGLQDPESLLRGTLGAYDPRMTEQFFDPFEERVVQQTIQDVLKRGEQADIAARAADIARGGESAFGSRARLTAAEREAALGRGLGEAIGGLRSAGFQRAQQAGMGEFGRQLEARRQAASGLAGLAGQRLGAQTTLGQTLADLGRTQQAAQFAAGQGIAGLGTQAQLARQADISQLLGVGAQQQQQQQAVLDAQRRMALQAQQAPLAQYQSLLPFVQAVPAGQQQVTTTFAPPPSPLQAGLGVGLAGLGALGQFMNQPQQQQFNPTSGTI